MTIDYKPRVLDAENADKLVALLEQVLGEGPFTLCVSEVSTQPSDKRKAPGDCLWEVRRGANGLSLEHSNRITLGGVLVAATRFGGARPFIRVVYSILPLQNCNLSIDLAFGSSFNCLSSGQGTVITSSFQEWNRNTVVQFVTLP